MARGGKRWWTGGLAGALLLPAVARASYTDPLDMVVPSTARYGVAGETLAGLSPDWARPGGGSRITPTSATAALQILIGLRAMGIPRAGYSPSCHRLRIGQSLRVVVIIRHLPRLLARKGPRNAGRRTGLEPFRPASQIR